MTEEILKLAKECGASQLMSPTKYEKLGLMGNDVIEAFYRAAFKEGVMAASRVPYGTGDEDMYYQIRELLK